MSEKRYHIESPEQLAEMKSLLKSGNLDSLITVWSTASRKGKADKWNKSFYVVLRYSRSERSAKIERKSMDGSSVVCAELKYNLATRWCKEHLKEE